jgi:hypothetical protein
MDLSGRRRLGRGASKGGELARRCAHSVGLTALGVVAASTPVLAQTAPVLPLGVARHVVIASQVVTTYDDNISGANAAGAALRHVTQSDVSVEPTVTIDASLPLSRESVFLIGSVGYDFHQRNTELNSEHVDLAGGVSTHLSRCLPSLTGNYARSQTQLETLLPGPAGLGASPQNISTHSGVALNVSCPRAGGLSPTISASYARNENDSKVFRATNSSSASVQGGLSYARPGFGAITAFGSFTSVFYDSPIVIPFPPFKLNNDYDIYSEGLHYDRALSSRLSGSVSVAYSLVRPALSFNPSSSSVTYSADLSYRASSRLNLHASVSRATLPTTEVGVAYIINDQRQLNASYRLGTRVTLNIGGSDNLQSYRGGGPLAGQVPNLVRSGRTDSVFGSVNIALNRSLSLSLNATREQRDANVALFGYTRDRVSLTLRTAF